MVKYSNEQLLESLVECKEKYGRITTQLLNRDDEFPSGPTYSYRFQSLSDAAKKAGLEQEAKKLKENSLTREGYSDSEIVSYINEIEKNGLVTPKIINENNGPSSGVIANYLGKTSIIGEEIDGIKIISSREYKQPSKETVSLALKEIAEEKGTVKNAHIRDSEISLSNVRHHYDSIRNAREELEISHTNQNTNKIKFPFDYIYVIWKNEEIYVGKSKNPLERIKSHMSKDNNIKLDRILKVPEDRDVLDYEREVAMDMAIEYETTNVNGGK